MMTLLDSRSSSAVSAAVIGVTSPAGCAAPAAAGALESVPKRSEEPETKATVRSSVPPVQLTALLLAKERAVPVPSLMVAVPVLMLHHFLERRVDAIVGEMEEKSAALTVIMLKNGGSHAGVVRQVA